MAADLTERQLHLHFIFAKGCAPCTNFKRPGGIYERLQKTFNSSKDVVIGTTLALAPKGGIRRNGVEGKLEREFIKYCDGWFPSSLLIPEIIYQHANELDLIDVLKCVAIFNGKFNFSDPKNPEIDGVSDYSTQTVETFQNFIDKYYKSAEYKYALGLMAKLKQTRSSVSFEAGPSTSSPLAMKVPPTTAATQTPEEALASMMQGLSGLTLGAKPGTTPTTSTLPSRSGLSQTAPLAKSDMMVPTGSSGLPGSCDRDKLLIFYPRYN
jgi:hypothetical protein